MELRETGAIAIEPEILQTEDDFDAGTVPPTGDYLLTLARQHPVYIRARMPKEQFHQFLLQNDEILERYLIRHDYHFQINDHFYLQPPT